MKYKYAIAYYEVVKPNGEKETRTYYSEYANRINESELRRDTQFSVNENIKYLIEHGDIISGNLLAVYPSNSAYPVAIKHQSYPLGGDSKW